MPPLVSNTTSIHHHNKIVSPEGHKCQQELVVSSENKQKNGSCSCCLPQHTGRKSKRVTFDYRVKARRTIHLSNYTSDELVNCWYTDDESQEIKRRVAMATKIFTTLVDPETHEDTDSLCLRGLEYRLPEAASIRREYKALVINMVLHEQEMQQNEGSHDPEYTASLYTAAATPAAKLAQSHGARDAKEVGR